ncbi:sensor histidine kinase [Caulobacter sp. KR2-114]|uniref:sensor histidine kinase n=1 Tax=Caulobacter sp. KR2-114 TaxID=3400912 RepID=UPI003BFDD129
MTTADSPARWLADNLETFATLFDIGGFLAGVVEEDGDDYRYVAANQKLAEHFRLSHDALIGKTGRELGATPELIASRMQALDKVNREGPQREEFSLTIRGERRRFLSVHTRAPAPEGGPRRMAYLSADITARRTAETEAARHRARAEAALEAANMGAWEYDIVTDRLVWDGRAEALIGLPGEPRSLEAFMDLLHPDDRPRVQTAQDAAEAGENDGYYRVEHRMIAPDGAQHWVESTGRILFRDGVPVSAVGTVRDIGEQMAARERQAFLTAELNHRVKNNLAAVQAIANQTLQWTPDPVEFRDAFQARVSALGRAHDLLNANAWQATDLRQIMQRSLEAAAGPVVLQGAAEPVLVLPERAMTLAIIFNELATNAAKHGAHARPGGQVTVSWKIIGDAVEILWTESGGPPVAPPRRQGFGSRILRAGVGGRDGAARLDYAPGGLRVRLTLHRSPAVMFEPAAELV